MRWKFPEHWDVLTCVNHLQRKIILCSICYYEFNFSPVSDFQYDEWSHQLVELMRDCENVEESTYWYVYHDFDGSTGYHLYGRLNDKDKEYLTFLAQVLGRR
jgi:hypothetical protein